MINHRFDSTTGELRAWADGRLTKDACLHLRSILAPGTLTIVQAFDEVVDVRRINLAGFVVRGEAVWRIVDLDLKLFPNHHGGRLAIVADQDAVYGPSMVYQAVAARLPWTTKVFAKWIVLSRGDTIARDRLGYDV